MTTTAKEWKEMCVVKEKLDDTMLKIDDMFLDISDGCQFREIFLSNRMCKHNHHLNANTTMNAFCVLDECPIVYEGVLALKVKE